MLTPQETAVSVVDRSRTGAVIADRWSGHATNIFLVAIAIMAVYALLKLTPGFGSLVVDSDGRPNAVDLKKRHDEVQRWFSGKPVYAEVERATSPPRSNVVLWPFQGWLPLAEDRGLWAKPTV